MQGQDPLPKTARGGRSDKSSGSCQGGPLPECWGPGTGLRGSDKSSGRCALGSAPSEDMCVFRVLADAMSHLILGPTADFSCAGQSANVNEGEGTEDQEGQELHESEDDFPVIRLARF